MAPGGHTIKAIEILPRIFGQGYSQPRFPEFRPAVMNFRASRLQESDSKAPVVVSDSCGWDCGAAKSTHKGRAKLLTKRLAADATPSYRKPLAQDAIHCGVSVLL